MTRLQASCGRALGMNGMCKLIEQLCNRRHCKQAKDADKLEPKGIGLRGWDWRSHPAIAAPSADRLALTHSVDIAELGKPVSFPLGEIDPRGKTIVVRVEEGGKSEGRCVMDRIGALNVAPCESIAHFHRVFDHKKLATRHFTGECK